MATTKRRILLLEGDIARRRALTAELESLGYWVAVAGNADKARCLQQEYDCDAALLAAQVKVGASGLYLTAYLHIEFPDLPVILYSDHTDVKMMREAMKLGAVDVLGAPMDSAELEQALVRAFDRKQRRAAVPPGTAALTPDEELRQEIIAALDQTDGNRTEAAKQLGISRSTLWSRMRALGIRFRPTKSMKPRRQGPVRSGYGG